MFSLNLVVSGQEQRFPVSNDSIEAMIKKSLNLYYDYKIKESMDHITQVIDHAHKMDNNGYKCRAYYILASNYELVEDFKNAEVHYKKSIEYAKKAKDSIRILWGINGLGNVYVSGYKNLEKGVAYYNESLALAKKIKKPSEEMAPILNTGWSYIDYKKYDKAFPYLIKAEALAKESGHAIALANVHYLMGKYHAGKNEFNKSNQYFDSVIEVGVKENMLSELNDTYQARYEIFKKLGKTDSALSSLEKHQFYKSKLYDEEKLKQIEIAKVNFSMDEYRRELETAKKEKEYLRKIAKNNQIITITSIGLIVLLAGLFFFYRSYLSKKRLNDVLNEKNQELIKAKAETEKLAIIKSQFVSTVSHELRTPLYGVVGITSLLLDDKEISHKHRKLLNSLKFSGDYLLDLVNKVLKIGKIESNNVQLVKTPTNLFKLSQNIINSLEYQGKENELILEVSEELPELLNVDSLKLSEVLMNLLGNASKFTEKGTVWLRIKVISIQDEIVHIRYEIEDNGIGIPEDKKEFVFEKFSQIGRESNKSEGTGLGLSIVTKLLQMMGSEIYLESKEEIGTKFYFDLKLEILDEEKKVALQTEEISVKSAQKILVAEDNKINQIVTKNLLNQIGHKCIIVENGFIALQRVKKENFDLILMDLNMPYLNGFDATKRIREFDKNIPIVALTASELREVQEECLSVGMNDIVNKPLNKNDLKRIIDKNLET